MSNLLMISGDRSLAEGKHGAFYNTLEELHKHFEKIDVICPKIRNSKLGIRNFFGNVEVHPSPWPLILQPFWIYRRGLKILKANGYSLMTNNYLMTVHDYPPFYNGFGAYLLSLATCVPYMLEIMHIPGLPKSGSSKEFIYKYLTKFFIRFDAHRARAVRVINHKQTKDFIIQAGVPVSKIKYIPAFYINLDVFKPISLEKKYDLIFVGRLESNKGVELLFEAIKNLKYQIPNIKCLIVGEGSLLNHCKLEIVNWKLQDNVLFNGFAKDFLEIARLINESKVLVMPSYNEGGPRVILEAMACGVPVLATPVGIVLDIVKDKESGVIIDWDGADIAKKINILLNDRQIYNKYQSAGLEIVKLFERQSAIKNYAEKLSLLIK